MEGRRVEMEIIMEIMLEMEEIFQLESSFQVRVVDPHKARSFPRT